MPMTDRVVSHPALRSRRAAIARESPTMIRHTPPPTVTIRAIVCPPVSPVMKGMAGPLSTMYMPAKTAATTSTRRPVIARLTRQETVRGRCVGAGGMFQRRGVGAVGEVSSRGGAERGEPQRGQGPPAS